MEVSEEFTPTQSLQQSSEQFNAPKKKQVYCPGDKNGRWGEQQNAMYIAYLQVHKDKFRSKQKRRASKFYKQMASFLKSRNALQCRSHHQKLEDRYHYANRIISNYKESNDLTLYSKYKKELQMLYPKSTPKESQSIKTSSAMNEISVQTELKGVNMQYLSMSEYHCLRGQNIFQPGFQSVHRQFYPFWNIGNAENYNYGLPYFPFNPKQPQYQ